MNFQEYLNEDKSSDYNGLTVYGRLLNVKLNKDQYNDLMSINVSGSERTLSVKSAETIKSEYKESDWNNIEKLYSSITDKSAKKIEVLVNKFEKELNKVVIELESEVKKKFG